MAGLIEKDRCCQHCGKSPITGYKYCSYECRYATEGHKERKEQLKALREGIQQQIEGIGVKICNKCNKEKGMTAFSTQGDWRSRKNTCKECLSIGEVYKTKQGPTKVEGDKKECGKCHTMKTLNAFSRRKGIKSGRKPYCKECFGRMRNPNYQPVDIEARKEKAQLKAQAKEAKSIEKGKLNEERLKRRAITQARIEAIRGFNEWKDKHASEEWKSKWHKGIRQGEWLRKGKETQKEWEKNNPEKVKNTRKACRLNRDAKQKELADGTVTGNAIKMLMSASKDCPYCGDDLIEGKIHLDHMIPTALSGEHSKYNLIACCDKCNARKSAKPFDVWADSLDIFRRGLIKEIYQAKQMVKEAYTRD